MTRTIAGLALLIGTVMTTAAPANAVPTGFRPGWRDAHERGLEIERWEQRKLERQQERRQQRRREQRREARREAAVEPTPVPTPTYTATIAATPWQLSEAEVASYVRQAGFPEYLVDDMVAIAERESNLCPTAVYGYGCAGEGHFYNGGPACGIFQLFECPGPSAMDPATNAAYAYQKYVNAGHSLSPWASSA